MTRRKTLKPQSSRRPARVLASDACPNCGTQMVEKRGTLRLPVNGEEIAVPSAAHLRCPRCGDVLLRYQDSRRLGEDVPGGPGTGRLIRDLPGSIEYLRSGAA